MTRLLSPVPISSSPFLDAELELLRALEDEISREEKKETKKQVKNKIKALPFNEDDDNYDESDEEEEIGRKKITK